MGCNCGTAQEGARGRDGGGGANKGFYSWWKASAFGSTASIPRTLSVPTTTSRPSPAVNTPCSSLAPASPHCRDRPHSSWALTRACQSWQTAHRCEKRSTPMQAHRADANQAPRHPPPPPHCRRSATGSPSLLPASQVQAPLSPAVAELIQQLGLQPHPEGGYYKETFRDERQTEGGRAASTAILYLLPAGAKSKLHRIDASECWHAYLGGWWVCGCRHGRCMHGRQWAVHAWAAMGGSGRVPPFTVCRPSAGSPNRTQCACTSCAAAGGAITVVELDASAPDGVRTTSVGRDLAAGQRLQHVVPPGTWFGAAPAEGTEWALVGCTVAPGGVRCAALCCAGPVQLLHPARAACCVGMCASAVSPACPSCQRRPLAGT